MPRTASPIRHRQVVDRSDFPPFTSKMRNFLSPLILCPLPSMTMWLVMAGRVETSVTSLSIEMVSTPPPRPGNCQPAWSPVGGVDLFGQGAEPVAAGASDPPLWRPWASIAADVAAAVLRPRPCRVGQCPGKTADRRHPPPDCDLAGDNKPGRRSILPSKRSAPGISAQALSGLRFATSSHAPTQASSPPLLAMMLLRRASSPASLADRVSPVPRPIPDKSRVGNRDFSIFVKFQSAAVAAGIVLAERAVGDVKAAKRGRDRPAAVRHCRVLHEAAFAD